MVCPVASLLHAVTRNPVLRHHAFKFALDHSSNALGSKSARAKDAPIPMDWVFDWLMEVALDFSSPKQCRVKLRESMLWVSKKVMFNLDIFEHSFPQLVAEVRALTPPASGAYVHNKQVGAALVEMNMNGQLFHHIFHHASFASHQPFASRKEFFRHLLGHARRRQQPLTRMELMYESAVFSWSMKFNTEGACTREPWNQTWREYAGRFALVQSQMAAFSRLNMTFRGQRHLAFDFFESHRNVSDCIAKLLGEMEMTTEKSFICGAWILGAGKNAHIRKALLQHTGWESAAGLPWSSFIVPWAHPSMFRECNLNRAPSTVKRSRKIAAIRRFFIVAAALDAAPEAHDCDISAWMGISGYESRFIAHKPHLEHVVVGLKRLADECHPPDVLCAAILEKAEEFCNENRATARYWTANEVLCACEVVDYDHAVMQQKLYAECCFAAIDMIQKFKDENDAKVKRVFTFREGANVSWLDVSFSHKKVWSKAKPQNVEMLVIRTSREYFITATDDALAGAPAPTIYAHPLSALRTSPQLAHPLWSARQDLLELCF